MKLYRNYSYSNNRQIWRIIPAGHDKLVIEERDPATREVFFSFIEMNTGNVILENLQFEEKFWIGVEEVYKDVIFLHKYQKPDMPGHADIIAYDLNKNEELWHSDEYLFSLILDDKLYCYKNLYEGRKYFELNCFTGELISELGERYDLIPGLKELRDNEIYKGYKFPGIYTHTGNEIDTIIDEIKSNEVVSGKIDHLETGNLLLISYHTVLDNGKLMNRFKVLDISSKKLILEEILNKEISNYIPDSFFLINDLVFLLKEKETLFVFLINE